MENGGLPMGKGECSNCGIETRKTRGELCTDCGRVTIGGPFCPPCFELWLKNDLRKVCDECENDYIEAMDFEYGDDLDEDFDHI